MKKKYTNYDMCKICGGFCCQKHGGIYKPSDFKESITPEFIVELLKSEKVAIDWWEGDVLGKNLSKTYFLRTRHVGESAIYGSYGGICVNWSESIGCSIAFENRPYQCKKLVPKLTDSGPFCDFLEEDKAEKEDCTIEWYPYQEIIQKSIKIYNL